VKIQYLLKLDFNLFYKVSEKKNMRISILMLIIVFTFLSCEKEEKKEVEIFSSIQLLNDKIIVDEDLSCSYQVPMNWDEMPVSLSEKMVARVKSKGRDGFIVYALKAFYYNDVDGSLLRVGQIKYKDNSSTDSLSIENYADLFAMYNRDLEIKITDVDFSKFRIKQIKIEKNNLMSFKFLFKNYNKEIIQFDYSVTKENHLQIFPTIMASINSIKLQ